MSKTTGIEASGVLKPILDAVAKRVAKKGAQAEALAFTSAFYRRMDADEISSRGADGWAELALAMLEFARSRKRGKANVQLTNPTLQAGTGGGAHTLLQIINDDMPFLVDSVAMALAELGVGVHTLGHPVVRMSRDRSGKLVGVGEGEPESVMYLELDRQPKASLAMTAL